jgi:retinol dehydrogenase 14
MEARTAIVTGANRGIGRETALGLAKAGLSVVMACRDLSGAILVRDELVRESGNPRVYAMELDLSSFASVRAFALAFEKEHGRLGILVNNAGITTQSFELTEDGFERTIATNFLGPFLLSSLMVPLFREGEDNRIVNLSSDFYKFGRFDLARLNRYRWIKAYAVSKYAVLLASLELAKRLQGRGISVNAAHPGVVRTRIMLTSKWYDAIIHLILAGMYVEAEEGARTSLHLALSEELRGRTGGYYAKGGEVPVPKRFDDARLREELFDYALGACRFPR